MGNLPNDSSFNQRQTYLHQYGFTLIELMVTVAVLGVIAAIAVPSYKAYELKNKEAALQSRMLSLSIELEKWRAKALTYRGFEPQSGYSRPGVVDYPKVNPEYSIQIGQLINANGSSSVKPLNSALGQAANWVMMATPVPTNSSSRYFKINSQGVRCVNNIQFDITASECGIGQQVW